MRHQSHIVTSRTVAVPNDSLCISTAVAPPLATSLPCFHINQSLVGPIDTPLSKELPNSLDRDHVLSILFFPNMVIRVPC